jgi:hypothetical protein
MAARHSLAQALSRFPAPAGSSLPFFRIDCRDDMITANFSYVGEILSYPVFLS